MKNVICEHCGTEIGDKPRMTFLGFQNYTCPKCGKKTLYSLTKGYRLIYWLIIAGAVLGFLAALQTGSILIPSIIAIAAAVGLWKDYKLRKSHA